MERWRDCDSGGDNVTMEDRRNYGGYRDTSERFMVSLLTLSSKYEMWYGDVAIFVEILSSSAWVIKEKEREEREREREREREGERMYITTTCNVLRTKKEKNNLNLTFRRTAFQNYLAR